MQIQLFKTLNKVLTSLSVNKKLSFETNDLFSFSDNKIITPVGNIGSLLLQHKSKLKDQFVNIDSLQNFVNQLTNDESIIRLNHMGFCYKVDSQKAEKERLAKLMKSSKFNLYQEPSNDDGMWFFIGNTDNWEEPMIEMLPVEKTNDKWMDYWLPHIQIDIDTTLTEKEIKTYAESIFGKSINPFSIAIDGVVYIVRNRLGTVDGVNITLDLATNSRNVKYQRLNLLKRVDIS